MSMSKKDFIALADAINAVENDDDWFSSRQLNILADFCQSQNPNFNRDRWLGYIAGTNGPSGGAR
jgi:hypothetical protein